jgi:hypothetical protein
MAMSGQWRNVNEWSKKGTQNQSIQNVDPHQLTRCLCNSGMPNSWGAALERPSFDLGSQNGVQNSDHAKRRNCRSRAPEKRGPPNFHTHNSQLTWSLSGYAQKERSANNAIMCLYAPEDE